MKKHMIAISLGLVLSSAFAQNNMVPQESFTPPTSSTAISQKPNTVNTEAPKEMKPVHQQVITGVIDTPTSNTPAPNKVNIPSLAKPSSDSENKGGSVSNTNNTVTPRPVVVEGVKSNSLNDIQTLSSQSNEEYMKRRNNTFQSSMSRCVNSLPKNTKGERSADGILKCMDQKAVAPTNLNTNKNTEPTKRSYLNE